MLFTLVQFALCSFCFFLESILLHLVVLCESFYEVQVYLVFRTKAESHFSFKIKVCKKKGLPTAIKPW